MAAWECSLCARSFVSQAARAAHINTSSRHPRCLSCNRGFLDHASKLQHLRTSPVHHYCRPCHRDFGSRQALDHHRQSAVVHRDPSQVRASSHSDDSGWIARYTGLRPADESDDDWASTVDTASEDGTGGADRLPSPNNSLVDQLVRTGPGRSPLRWTGPILWPEDSDGDGGDDGSYLEPNSEEVTTSEDDDDDDDDDEEDEEDSDFLEHSSASSDSDSDDASDTPFSLSSDVHRSTLTRGSIPTSTTASASRTSFSTNTTTASSSFTLANAQTAGSPRHDNEKRMLPTFSGYTCPLCLEQDGLELTSVKCGHVFCTPCISRALKKKSQCPVCRARARTKDLRRIYLNF